MSEASNQYGYRRHHTIGTEFDVQGISYQGSRPTKSSHTQEDYSVLQDPME
jgi:hypothetical protein